MIYSCDKHKIMTRQMQICATCHHKWCVFCERTHSDCPYCRTRGETVESFTNKQKSANFKSSIFEKSYSGGSSSLSRAEIKLAFYCGILYMASGYIICFVIPAVCLYLYHKTYRFFTGSSSFRWDFFYKDNPNVSKSLKSLFLIASYIFLYSVLKLGTNQFSDLGYVNGKLIASGITSKFFYADNWLKCSVLLRYVTIPSFLIYISLGFIIKNKLKAKISKQESSCNDSAQKEAALEQTIVNWDSDDPFKILNLSTDATLEQIKSQYHKMIIQYHPDKYANSPAEFKKLAEETTKILNWAYSQCLERKAS